MIILCAELAAAQQPTRQEPTEPKSIQHYQKLLEFRTRLAAMVPEDAGAQQKLAVAHENLARTRLRFGDVAEALESAQIALDIKQKLHEADPEDFVKRFDLCVAIETHGNALLQAARYEEALAQHQKRLEVSRQLLEADPGRAAAQFHLAIAFQNLGAVQSKFREYSEALTSFQQMSAVLEELIAADPDNVRYPFALFVSYQKAALVLAQMTRYEEAAASYARGLDLLRSLKEKNQLILANQEWIGVGELVIRKYRHADLALGDWDVLMQQPADLQILLLDLRGNRFARDGRNAEAVQAANKLRERKPTEIWPLYNAACVYALCAESLGRDSADPAGDTPAERERLIAESLATLREAFAIGWDDIAHLQHDIDLSVLRDRAEFQQLVSELKAQVKAADPDYRQSQ